MRYLKDINNFVKGKTVFCGIDIHKEHWNLCYCSNGEVVEKLRIRSEFAQLKSHTENLYSSASSVQFVYEAGFSGFWLYRKLTDSGYDCLITPPNKIPSNPDKVKTDKKDSEKLARYLAGGLLKKVYVPPPSIEADRQLLRLWEGDKKKLTRVKNQINSQKKPSKRKYLIPAIILLLLLIPVLIFEAPLPSILISTIMSVSFVFLSTIAFLMF